MKKIQEYLENLLVLMLSNTISLLILLALVLLSLMAGEYKSSLKKKEVNHELLNSSWKY